jgi:hypothetical protein
LTRDAAVATASSGPQLRSAATMRRLDPAGLLPNAIRRLALCVPVPRPWDCKWARDWGRAANLPVLPGALHPVS